MMHKTIKYDVIVVGAGAAGVPAAVASARTGARTLLLEKESLPGGAAVPAMHQSICGMYVCGDDLPAETLNAGLAREISLQLKQISSKSVPSRIGRTYVLPYDAGAITSIFTSMIAGEKNLDVLYNSPVVGLKMDGDLIVELAVEGRDGRTLLMPEIVIDCSGDGVLLGFADIPSQIAVISKRQAAGYTIMLGGLVNVDHTLRIKVPYFLMRAVESGRIPSYLRFTSFMPSFVPSEGYCKLTLPPFDVVNSQDSLTAAVTDAQMVLECLSDSLSEFSGVSIINASATVMNRECRRLQGKYTLTEYDLLCGCRFDDCVARGAWPIEFWNQETGPSYEYIGAGAYYEIPLGALQSDVVSNLLCAGRCISATSKALASTRVMGTCFAIGEAAGTFAGEQGGRETRKSER